MLSDGLLICLFIDQLKSFYICLLIYKKKRISRTFREFIKEYSFFGFFSITFLLQSLLSLSLFSSLSREFLSLDLGLILVYISLVIYVRLTFSLVFFAGE